MEISLTDKRKWQVKGYWPYVPIKETSMELGQELKGTTNWMDAIVPGAVQFDLYKNGYIEHPYFDQNSLHCEWVENRWWVYRTEFAKPELLEKEPHKKVFLKLEGVDYQVMIYCNDVLLGEHTGMYEPVSFDITDLVKKENTLVLVFRGVPDEMGQIGYTSKTSTQKSRFNYKWDFSTRLVPIGIWKEIKLVVEEEVSLYEPYVYTAYEAGMGSVVLEGRIWGKQKDELEISYFMELTDPSNGTVMEAECDLKHGMLNGMLLVENVKPWFPNGLGEQPLYQLKVIARTSKRVVVLYEQKIGIRSVSLLHNENEHKGALPYTFTVNGKRIYVKGINMTPLDHLYGTVAKEQYRHFVDVCVNANVNLIRVWGGGLIEKEWLYEYCDRAGILIWQEFIQSSSGIDNKPCEDEPFLVLLERNSRAAILGKRNYTSLAVWSGGNELTEAGNVPCGYENKNIAMLKQLVAQLDRTRYFFPTSASGPEEFVSLKRGVSHDVHGGWRYEGNPVHYEKYGTSDHLFHSEFGTDGASSFKSIQKFFPSKDWYPTPMSGNLTWQHHGEWWGTYYRDVELFGAITDFKEYIRLSQYMQAEGLRFMIEANRRRKYRCSGSIIWQLNEPWPNVSCTNLMDYYGELKPAYYAAARAFRPVHVSLDYRRLDLTQGQEEAFSVVVHNSMDCFEAIVTGEALTREGKVLSQKRWNCSIEKDYATQAGEWKEAFAFQDVLFIRVRVYNEGCIAAENTYAFGERKENIEDGKQLPVLAGLRGLNALVTCNMGSVAEVDTEEYLQHICLKNEGSQVAVQAGVELDQDDFLLLAEDNYICLFPGEERHVTLHIRKRKFGGFLEEYNATPDSKQPNCVVSWL